MDGVEISCSRSYCSIEQLVYDSSSAGGEERKVKRERVVTRKEVYSVCIICRIYKSELPYIVVTTNEDNVNIKQNRFNQASTLSSEFFFPSHVIKSCVSFPQECP